MSWNATSRVIPIVWEPTPIGVILHNIFEALVVSKGRNSTLKSLVFEFPVPGPESSILLKIILPPLLAARPNVLITVNFLAIDVVLFVPPQNVASKHKTLPLVQ